MSRSNVMTGKPLYCEDGRLAIYKRQTGESRKIHGDFVPSASIAGGKSPSRTDCSRNRPRAVIFAFGADLDTSAQKHAPSSLHRASCPRARAGDSGQVGFKQASNPPRAAHKGPRRRKRAPRGLQRASYRLQRASRGMQRVFYRLQRASRGMQRVFYRLQRASRGMQRHMH
jgi:hypothetical protein